MISFFFLLLNVFFFLVDESKTITATTWIVLSWHQQKWPRLQQLSFIGVNVSRLSAAWVLLWSRPQIKLFCLSEKKREKKKKEARHFSCFAFQQILLPKKLFDLVALYN